MRRVAAALVTGGLVVAGFGASAVPATGVQNLNSLTDGTAQLQTWVNVNIDGEWYDVPVCAAEDCSDQPMGVGAWRDPDTGRWWVSFGEDVSYPVSYSKMGGRVR